MLTTAGTGAAASVTATRKATTMMTTRNMNSGSGTTTTTTTTNSSNTNTNTSVSRGIATDTHTAKTTIKTKATTTTTTTITSDPGILCFHHCNVKVFCFTLPHICPQCKTALATHPNGDNNNYSSTSSSAAAGGGGSSNRRKNKNMTKLKLKNNKSNNYNVDQSHAIDSNKDENANNDIGDRGSKSHDDDEDDDTDDSSHDEDCDDDADNDLNRNSFSSHIMASRLLPFRLPYPFVRANQYPCAIVLRPTTGDFLNDYNNTTDLHIAVTTSTGCVVEFDRHGLRRHRTDNMSEWWQCLLVGDVPEPWYDYWDQVLFEICQQPDKWTVSHYHEDKHNCYTFVLTFLQALTYDKLSEAATSKTRFCEKYIVPRTTTAGKYISLYRKLRDAGIYVHHTNHQKVRYAKQGKQQLLQQHQQLQRNPNKSNNLTTTAAAGMNMTKNSLVTNKHQQQKLQQQHLSNHHNHHSIILRPHSTLCTIEE